ncbi:MAG: response regulator transcription factor [Chloroflexi bacterium]|jgi:DNA-binding NarL/FixJ family response regulator|nr:response regulator transcription factor [Chloroflexota bacterium]
MARRVIRRRRPSGGRVIRRVAKNPARVASKEAVSSAVEPKGTPVLMATTNNTRNLILPKLAAIADIQLAGLSDTPATALKLLVQEHPEVVVFDMDFGGSFIGLDTARMMQKTRIRAAVVMLLPELDIQELHRESRRFGTSWSYVRKTTAARVDVLETVLKSAARGVQWIEPALSRPLATIWKVAEEARDLEAVRDAAEPVPVTSRTKIKNAKFAEPEPMAVDPDIDVDEIFEEDEIAPGIKTKSTSDPGTDGLNITSVSVGHGGIGQNVGKVRRTG